MQKKSTNLLPQIRALGLAAGVLLSAQSTFGQAIMASSQEVSSSPQKGTRSLKTILTELGTTYQVNIMYEESQISGKYLAYPLPKQPKVERALDLVLRDLGLKYKKVDDGVYAILPVRKEAKKVPVLPTPSSQSSVEPRPESTLRALDVAVNGVVNDDKGVGIPGVSVLLKGGTQGTTTNADGAFSLTLPDANGTLVFSSIGFETLEVPLIGRSSLTVQLRPDVKALSEVVVVGYGTQKKVNVTGSVATVDEKFLANRPLTNSEQALQGILGVYVNQPTAQPGADGANIRIRGLGTLGSNDPLVLVDGIAYSLRDINPNDIESISVLKDAASAAIYGNRAANGVILIKTKSGQKGKLKVDYNNYVGFQRVTYLPDAVFNSVEYMEGKNRALANEGKQPEYSQATIDEFRNNPNNPEVYPNTNWFDVLFSRAPMQEHNLRFSGGSDRTTFSISAGYLNQQGILMGSDARKYSIGSSITSEVSKRLKMGLNLSGTYWDRNESVIGNDYLMNQIYRVLPTQPTLMSDGRYADTWVRTPGHNLFRNPIALATEGSNNNATMRMLANLFAEYRLPFDLTYKVNVAINYFNGIQSRFVPLVTKFEPKSGVTTPIDFNGMPRSAYRAQNGEMNLTMFHTLNYQKQLGAHQLGGLLGYSAESFYNSNFNAYREGYFGNELTELNAGSLNPQVNGGSGRNRLLSYFGRLNYNYLEKYLLEFNFRNDGSSRFAAGNRWGFFPSVSAGWRLSEEEFLKNVAAVSNLKLRASWGRLGNQEISAFSFVNAVSIGRGLDYTFNNQIAAGAAVNSFSDPNISWETTTITNLGLDAGLFSNKLNLELEWYEKLTSGILQGVTIPDQIGKLDGPVQNVGDVRNRGIELTITHRSKLGKEFEYNAGFNVAYNRNEVTNLGGQVLYGSNTITQEGSPIRSYYLLEAEGIFQNEEEIKAHAFQNNATKPGDIKYRDVDGNGIIDNNDRVITGRSFPEYTYSFTLGANYKGFDFSTLFNGIANVDTYVTHNYAQPYNNGAGVTREWLTDSWTPENPNARLPRLTTATGYPQNFQNSTFWLQDISYLRLKNIQLGYTLPTALTQRVGISRARVYVNGQNVLTFSDYTLTDPERGKLYGTLFEYPSAKTYTAGLSITF
ncbi:TonB-dependent receptor [Rhabdobacter roseus]|uniref:TonB-linked SusC/RagA family outer membrane protein n=1 Tax=Rhabdobacter roseus TaxID=1655419 RepID=A0A840TPD9_9BACT|nr:TonB-dependent receptor [Rhabdobacter roseus]MBB5283607.1 TonB-linked SusC/RagA family outer membrane protein [Rhabdobacter roseus]